MDRISVEIVMCESFLFSIGTEYEGSEFESRCGQEFCLLHVVQTGSGFHPTSSYPMSAGGSFPGGKPCRVVKLRYLQLVPRSRKSGSVRQLSHTPS
jgi:hypothetical protein